MYVVIKVEYKVQSHTNMSFVSEFYSFFTLCLKFCRTEITIKVPVVYMAQYVMLLRRSTSLQGALEGVGPENQNFFGP